MELSSLSGCVQPNNFPVNTRSLAMKMQSHPGTSKLSRRLDTLERAFQVKGRRVPLQGIYNTVATAMLHHRPVHSPRRPAVLPVNLAQVLHCVSEELDTSSSWAMH